MTEHKTLNTVIHAAFRRDLARFDSALVSRAATTHTRADRIGVAWDNFAAQLRQHHADEEQIFWPAFRELGFDPVIAAELDSEHQRMIDALEAAESAMDAYRSAPDPATADRARAAVDHLGAVLTTHLRHEEHDLEPWAAAQEGTPQLRACAKEVRKAHRGDAGTFFAWLSDGAGPDEVAMLRRTVPAPVLWAMTTLGGRGYRKEIGAAWT